jgi:hypothetical protein
VPYLIFGKVMGISKSPLLYGGCMEPGCIGKSNTNNLPAPTDLTENPYGEKKRFFNDATQNSARVVLSRIEFWIVPREPIFEKYPHLREKGGVLTLKTPVGFALSHTVSENSGGINE